jgi:hypothetical protein
VDPEGDGTLSFLVEVAGRTLTVLVQQDRGAGVLGDDGTIPQETCSAARRAAFLFTGTHRVVTHQLLQLAKHQIRPPYVRWPDGRVSAPPQLEGPHSLLFSLTVGTQSLLMRIGNDLQRSGIDAREGTFPDVHILYPAYDAALDYMIHHVSELESLGFDTTYLKEQMRDARTFPGCEDIPDPDA